MAVIAIPGAPGGSFGYSGEVHRRRPAAGVLGKDQTLTIPSGLNIVDRKGSHVVYKNRFYVCGRGTQNFLVDEFWRVSICGIRPPVEIPTLAASGTGITGDVVGYFTFYDEKTGERSPLSGASSSLTLSNQGVSWGNVPTSSKDPRVSHVEFWRSVDGGSVRFVTRRQIGVPSLTESVATLALGEAFGTTFEAMPRGDINAVYNERMFVAGDSANPDTLYASALFFPERYEGLSFATKNGEPIVALAPAREVLIAFTPRTMYALRGFTEDDMVFKPIEHGVGAINHACVKVIRDNIWFVNDQGFFLWNGGLVQLNKDREEEWKDTYAAYRSDWDAGFAVHDSARKTYVYYAYLNGVTAGALFTGRVPDPAEVVPKQFGWGISYREMESGGPPIHFLDVMSREAAWGAEIALPGTKRSDTYLGFCDGHIRQFDDTDDNDDGDNYDKLLVIRTGAQHFGDPGNMPNGGKTLVEAWSYMECENDAWEIHFKAGDDSAVDYMLPPDNDDTYFKENIVASEETSHNYDGRNFTLTAKTVHPHRPEKVTGRTIGIEIQVSNPLGVRWSGWGGRYEPGPATRPVSIDHGSPS